MLSGKMLQLVGCRHEQLRPGGVDCSACSSFRIHPPVSVSQSLLHCSEDAHICLGSSIAWMSTQSYDDYDGDDDKLNQQEFIAGNLRSFICFSLIKAPSRNGTQLEISSICVDRTCSLW